MNITIIYKKPYQHICYHGTHDTKYSFQFFVTVKQTPSELMDHFNIVDVYSLTFDFARNKIIQVAKSQYISR